MVEIRLSEPYYPIDSETGRELPTTRTFEVDEIGYGTAEVFHDNDFIFPAVKVTFMQPGTEGMVCEEAVWVDDDHSSLTVVTSDELLVPAMKRQFSQLRV